MLLLFGSYTWILGIGQIGSDIPAAAALFVAAFTPSVMVCLLLLGFALSWKYTSIGLVLAVIVLRVRTRRHILQMGLWIAGLLSLGVLPNILKGYHPLFPYLGWL